MPPSLTPLKKPANKEQWHQLTLGFFDIGLLRASSPCRTLERIVLEEMGAGTPENRRDLTPYIIRLLRLSLSSLSSPCPSCALEKNMTRPQLVKDFKGKRASKLEKMPREIPAWPPIQARLVERHMVCTHYSKQLLHKHHS